MYQGILQPQGFPGLPEGWVSESGTFESSDGALKIFAVTHWKEKIRKASGESRKTPKVLAVFHGLGEHGGRFLHFPHYLQEDVDAVYCQDHRGHGRSEGLRGHADRFDLLTEDVVLGLKRLDESLRREFGSSDIHVFGHSMGGLVSLRAHFLNADLPVKSLTVCSPLLGIRVKIPFFKKVAAIGVAKIWGKLQMKSEVDATILSHDQAVVEAYRQDRLVHDRVTPQFFVGLQAAIADTAARTSGMNYPLQMLLPEDDRLVDSDVSQHFFRALKHRDKELKTYPRLFHEPFNEPEKAAVFEDIRQWMQRWIQKP